MRLPTLFLSHGAPTFLLENNATTRFWQSLPDIIPGQPRAILCISAHWDAAQFRLSGTTGKTGIQHDFYGFPESLYDITWPEQNDDEISACLKQRLREAAIDVVEDSRAKDHGVWVPLKFSWPEPAFPVYQLSLSLSRGVDSHWTLGKKLSELRNEGVLIICSGGITHNLRSLNWNAPDGSVEPWARDFVEAVEHAIASNDRVALCKPWSFPGGKEAHPTVEHYVPMVVMMGAADGDLVKNIHRSWMYGNFSLNAYGAGMQD